MPIYVTLILMAASFVAGAVISYSIAYSNGYKDGEISKLRFMEKRALRQFDKGIDYIYKLWKGFGLEQNIAPDAPGAENDKDGLPPGDPRT